MHRLFVAIPLPPSTRRRLLEAMGGISGARWRTEDQLHLTLRFIGEVDRHMARDVDAALASVRHPPFALALSGVGSFDRRGQVDTVWAGVTPHAPLKTLHDKLGAALLRVGLSPDPRAYLPHVTLARLGRGGGPIDHFLASAGRLVSPAFTVEGFALYESDLTAEAAIHSLVARYSLA